VSGTLSAVFATPRFLAADDSLTNFVDFDVPGWAWILLLVLIVVLLGIDLYLHRHAHAPTLREAGRESAAWVTVGLLFTGFMWWQFGAEASAEYLGVYVTEKSLSADNVFVWALLFGTMQIPLKYQHRVLFWGIFGALALRGLFIGIGAELIRRFWWVLLVFGGFLIWTGIRIIRERNSHEDEEASQAGLALLRRLIPVTDQYDDQKFFTMIDGVRHATPLFAALIVVEFTDVVFAFDSVPASFGVANEPYTIFAANAFAIMGLRAMYFLLAGAREQFVYLNHALGAILLFVGIKLTIARWYHVNTWVALGVIAFILTAGVIASVRHNRQTPNQPWDNQPVG